MTVKVLNKKDVVGKPIYVSGKMTGLPEYNYPKFEQVTAELRAMGFTVVCPTELNKSKDWSWKRYMKENIKLLLECDYVYVIEGYEDSKGANIEIDLAKAIGLDIVYEGQVEFV